VLRLVVVVVVVVVAAAAAAVHVLLTFKQETNDALIASVS
jgi:hypothetical protein